MDLLQWITVTYLVPLFISIIYFTMLKVEDLFKIEKSFSKDKYSYLKCIGISFIPVLNIVIALMVIWKQIVG